jgi:hypothetical protein
LSPYPNYVFPGNFAQYSQSITLSKSEKDGEGWKIASAIATSGLLEGDERIKNPYVRIVDRQGEEVLKWVVHEGDVDFLEASSKGVEEDIPLEAGDQIIIGYEYDLLSDIIESEMRFPLIKEFVLVDMIGASTLAKRKELCFFYLYSAFPDTRGDDYFQRVTLFKDSAVWTLSSVVFGGELRLGDDYVVNPFVRITDGAGEEVKTLVLFDGKMGSTEAKKRGFAERSIKMSALPEEFRVFVGYEFYYDGQYPQEAGGPLSVEIMTPPLLENR